MIRAIARYQACRVRRLIDSRGTCGDNRSVGKARSGTVTPEVQAIANDLKTAVGGATRLLGLFQSDGDPYVICSGTGEFAGSGRLKVTYT